MPGGVAVIALDIVTSLANKLDLNGDVVDSRISENLLGVVDAVITGFDQHQF